MSTNGADSLYSRIWRTAALAVGFLTIVPVRSSSADQGRAAPWALAFFPLVGLALGGILHALAAALSGWPQMSVAILIVVALAVLTGGLHLDGLADTIDGLGAGHGAGGDAERILDVMKDPHIGLSGALGVLLTLLAKVALLRAVPREAVPIVVLVLPVAGRFPFLLFMPFLRYARTAGAGSLFAGAGPAQFAVGAALTALACGLAGATGAAALGAGIAWSLIAAAYFRRRLGGYTGDVLGAVAETAEVVALLAMVLFLRYA